MTPPFSDFVDMVAALQDAGAEFVIVGGHAVAFHGSARATKDIDVLLNPTPANAARVVRALHLFGAPVVALGITEDDFAHPGSVVQLGVPPVRIALLTRIDGVSFEEGRTDRPGDAVWSARGTRDRARCAVEEQARQRSAAGSRGRGCADASVTGRTRASWDRRMAGPRLTAGSCRVSPCARAAPTRRPDP